MRSRLLVPAAILVLAVAAGTLVVTAALGRSGHAMPARHGLVFADVRPHHVRAVPNWEARLLRHHRAPTARRARIAATSSTVNAYSNGFETNTNGWCDTQVPCDGRTGSGTIDREPNGYSDYGLYAPMINAATGAWHARTAGAPNQSPFGTPCVGSGTAGHGPSGPCVGPYTTWGVGAVGSSTFPTGGFTTSLDIYLDKSFAQDHPDDSSVGPGSSQGFRFDWDDAISDNTGQMLTEFVFNAGTAPSGWPGGAGFVINTSQFPFRSGAAPEDSCPDPSSAPNACRAPVTITSSGWYTFIHRFFEDGDGNLAVEMTLKDASGTLVPGADWTIHTTDAIAGVGGPYAANVQNDEILGLPIDNAKLTLAQSYSTQVLSDNPVSFWRLAEAPGSTTAADSADSNNGSYSNSGVTLGVAGPVCGETAASFNGTTGKVTVPPAGNLQMGDTFTIEAWLKPSQLGITNGYAAKSGSWQVLLTGPNKIQLYQSNVGPIATSTTGITDTTAWHHVAVTKSGSSVHIYLDGADVTGPITNRTLTNGTGAFLIGAGASFFHGSIADVALYNYALSAARAATHRSSTGC